jgi:plastocyanin
MFGKTIAVLAAIAAVTAGITASAFAATTHIVSVRDDSFSKSSITIPRNDTVTWKWRNTGDDHQVKSPSSSPVAFRSAMRSGNFSYSHKFSKTGTYKIFCTVHPDTMKITVKVKRG